MKDDKEGEWNVDIKITKIKADELKGALPQGWYIEVSQGYYWPTSEAGGRLLPTRDIRAACEAVRAYLAVPRGSGADLDDKTHCLVQSSF